MKPHQVQSICSCISCLYKTELGSSSFKQKGKEGATNIEKLFYDSNLPLREKKLVEKLIKTREIYDDIRNQILSRSNVSVREKINTKLKERSRFDNDDIERSNALLEIVSLVDRGDDVSPKLSECCSCCSCGSKSEFLYRRHRDGRHVRQHHARGSSRSSLQSGVIFKRRAQLDRRYRSRGVQFKRIRSDPCTCTLKFFSKQIFPTTTQNDDSIEKLEKEGGISGLLSNIQEGGKKSVKKIVDTTNKVKSYCQCIQEKSIGKLKQAKYSMKEKLDAMQTEYVKRHETESTILFDELGMKVKKDSITKFREKLRRRKLEREFECEHECSEEECLPEDCLEKLNLKRGLRQKHEKQLGEESLLAGIGEDFRKKTTKEIGLQSPRITIKMGSKGPEKTVSKQCACTLSLRKSIKSSVKLKTSMPKYTTHHTSTSSTDQHKNTLYRKQKLDTKKYVKNRRSGKKSRYQSASSGISHPVSIVKKPMPRNVGTERSTPHVSKSRIQTSFEIDKVKRKSDRLSRAVRGKSTTKFNLHRCFCTLKLISSQKVKTKKIVGNDMSNQTTPHQMTSTSAETNSFKVKKHQYDNQRLADKPLLVSKSSLTPRMPGKILSLLPYECEPGVCIPNKCDPYECLDIINKRKHRRKRKRRHQASDKYYKMESKSSFTPSASSHRAKKVQSSMFSYKSEDQTQYNNRNNFNEENRIQEIPRLSGLPKVKLSSSFSFNIEISKGIQLSMNDDNNYVYQHQKPAKSESISREQQKQEIKKPKSFSKSSVKQLKKVNKGTHATTKSKNRIVKTPSQKFLQKSIEQQLHQETSTDSETYLIPASVTKATETKINKISEGIKRRKKQILKESGTSIDQRKIKTASSSTDNIKISEKAVPLKSFAVNQPTINFNKEARKADTIKNKSKESRDRTRQAVNIGSSFSFSIEISKTRMANPELPSPEKDLMIFENNYDKEIEPKKHGKENLLKRCYCTLKFKNQKTPTNVFAINRLILDKNRNRKSHEEESVVYSTTRSQFSFVSSRFDYNYKDMQSYFKENNALKKGCSCHGRNSGSKVEMQSDDCNLENFYTFSEACLIKRNKKLRSLKRNEYRNSCKSFSTTFSRSNVTGISSLLKRCFCTMNIQINERKNHQSRRYQLKPFKCEPGICISGEFNPYEDLIPLIESERNPWSTKPVQDACLEYKTEDIAQRPVTSHRYLQSGKNTRYNQSNTDTFLKKCFWPDGIRIQESESSKYRRTNLVSSSLASMGGVGTPRNSNIHLRTAESAIIRFHQPRRRKYRQIPIQEVVQIGSRSCTKRKDTSHNENIPRDQDLITQTKKCKATDKSSWQDIVSKSLGFQYSKPVYHRDPQSLMSKIRYSMSDVQFLNRCYSTIKLSNSDKTLNRPVNMQNQKVYLATLHNLSPYECEPGVCIPYECNPYECEERIKKRNKHSKLTEIQRPGVRSSAAYASGVLHKTKSTHRVPQTGTVGVSSIKKNKNKRAYMTDKHRDYDARNHRQKVKIGSNFSFDIEFFKDKPSLDGQVEQTLEMKNIPAKNKAPHTNHDKKKHMYSNIDRPREKHMCSQINDPKSRDKVSQVNKAEMQSKGVGQLHKRCFCTLKLQKLGADDRKIRLKERNNQTSKTSRPHLRYMTQNSVRSSTPKNVKSKKNEMKDLTATTQTKKYKLLPYECEPGICTPGLCDPYECLERIKRREIRNFSTSTKPIMRERHIDARSKIKRLDSAQQIKHKPKKPTYTTSRQRVHSPSYITRNENISNLPGRQAVRIASSFSFSIEFFKDQPHPVTQKQLNRKPDFPNTPNRKVESLNTRSVKMRNKNEDVMGGKKRHAKTITSDKVCSADKVCNTVTRLQCSKECQNCSNTECKSTGMGPFLKRCFCTLKLQKPYDKSRLERYVGNLNKAGFTRTNDQKIATKRFKSPKSPQEDDTAAKTQTKNYKLLPYECEQGFCTPGQCDPYVCLERIKQRNMSKKVGTKSFPSRKSGTSSISRKVMSGQCPGSYCTGICQTDKQITSRNLQKTDNIVEERRFQNIYDRQQGVKYGSNISFNIEFYKEKVAPNFDKIKSTMPYDGNTDRYYKPTQIQTQHLKQNTDTQQMYDGEKFYRTANIQSESIKLENKGTGVINTLKRCFCTLNFQKNILEASKQKNVAVNIVAIENTRGPFRSFQQNKARKNAFGNDYFVCRVENFYTKFDKKRQANGETQVLYPYLPSKFNRNDSKTLLKYNNKCISVNKSCRLRLRSIWPALHANREGVRRLTAKHSEHSLKVNTVGYPNFMRNKLFVSKLSRLRSVTDRCKQLFLRSSKNFKASDNFEINKQQNSTPNTVNTFKSEQLANEQRNKTKTNQMSKLSAGVSKQMRSNKNLNTFYVVHSDQNFLTKLRNDKYKTIDHKQGFLTSKQAYGCDCFSTCKCQDCPGDWRTILAKKREARRLEQKKTIISKCMNVCSSLKLNFLKKKEPFLKPKENLILQHDTCARCCGQKNHLDPKSVCQGVEPVITAQPSFGVKGVPIDTSTDICTCNPPCRCEECHRNATFPELSDDWLCPQKYMLISKSNNKTKLTDAGREKMNYVDSYVANDRYEVDKKKEYSLESKNKFTSKIKKIYKTKSISKYFILPCTHRMSRFNQKLKHYGQKAGVDPSKVSKSGRIYKQKSDFHACKTHNCSCQVSFETGKYDSKKLKHDKKMHKLQIKRQEHERRKQEREKQKRDNLNNIDHETSQEHKIKKGKVDSKKQKHASIIKKNYQTTVASKHPDDLCPCKFPCRCQKTSSKVNVNEFTCDNEVLPQKFLLISDSPQNIQFYGTSVYDAKRQKLQKKIQKFEKKRQKRDKLKKKKQEREQKRESRSHKREMEKLEKITQTQKLNGDLCSCKFPCSCKRTSDNLHVKEFSCNDNVLPEKYVLIRDFPQMDPLRYAQSNVGFDTANKNAGKEKPAKTEIKRQQLEGKKRERKLQKQKRKIKKTVGLSMESSYKFPCSYQKTRKNMGLAEITCNEFHSPQKHFLISDTFDNVSETGPETLKQDRKKSKPDLNKMKRYIEKDDTKKRNRSLMNYISEFSCGDSPIPQKYLLDHNKQSDISKSCQATDSTVCKKNQFETDIAMKNNNSNENQNIINRKHKHRSQLCTCKLSYSCEKCAKEKKTSEFSGGDWPNPPQCLIGPDEHRIHYPKICQINIPEGRENSIKAAPELCHCGRRKDIIQKEKDSKQGRQSKLDRFQQTTRDRDDLCICPFPCPCQKCPKTLDVTEFSLDDWPSPQRCLLFDNNNPVTRENNRVCTSTTCKYNTGAKFEFFPKNKSAEGKSFQRSKSKLKEVKATKFNPTNAPRVTGDPAKNKKQNLITKKKYLPDIDNETQTQLHSIGKDLHNSTSKISRVSNIVGQFKSISNKIQIASKIVEKMFIPKRCICRVPECQKEMMEMKRKKKKLIPEKKCVCGVPTCDEKTKIFKAMKYENLESEPITDKLESDFEPKLKSKQDRRSAPVPRSKLKKAKKSIKSEPVSKVDSDFELKLQSKQDHKSEPVPKSKSKKPKKSMQSELVSKLDSDFEPKLQSKQDRKSEPVPKSKSKKPKKSMQSELVSKLDSDFEPKLQSKQDRKSEPVPKGKPKKPKKSIKSKPVSKLESDSEPKLQSKKDRTSEPVPKAKLKKPKKSIKSKPVSKLESDFEPKLQSKQGHKSKPVPKDKSKKPKKSIKSKPVSKLESDFEPKLQSKRNRMSELVPKSKSKKRKLHPVLSCVCRPAHPVSSCACPPAHPITCSCSPSSKSKAKVKEKSESKLQKIKKVKKVKKKVEKKKVQKKKVQKKPKKKKRGPGPCQRCIISMKRKCEQRKRRAARRRMIKKAFKHVRKCVKYTSKNLERVKAEVASTQAMKSITDTLERHYVSNFILHARDPKKRFTPKRKKLKQPVDFECSLFMGSLRRKPWMCVYYLCPWFYPHCISFLNIWKQFTDVILFLLAVGVWSPCILAIEICRAFVCCTFCTG